MNLQKRKCTYTMETGVCRFCCELKKCRIVNNEYDYMGQKEVYSDMLMECFGIMLSNIDGSTSERLVCATCVVRLRAGCSFKRQVLRCESQLLEKLHDESTCSLNIKEELLDRDQVDYLDDTIFYDDGEKADSSEADSMSPLKKKESPADKRSLILEIKPLVERPVPTFTKSTKAERPQKPSAVKKIIKKSNTIPNDVKEMKLKKLLLLKMERLKAEQQRKSIHLAALPTGKRMAGTGKEVMKFQNTVQIIECSHVCPFNNINGTYYCFYCRSVFRDPADLREHTATHDPKIFERYYPKRKAVKIDITRIDCRLCDAQITDIDTLKKHLTTAHNKKIHPVDNEFLKFRLTQSNVPCLECGQTFIFIDKLIDHMSEHFGSFICEICGAAFVQASSLDSHIRCHNKADVRFPCHICGKNLSTNRSRYVHVSVVHEKKPVIDCFDCEERFFSYDQRNKHMMEAHNRNMNIPCDICGKVFDSRKKFISHNQMVHLKVLKYNCQMCDKKFITTKQLSKHVAWHKKK